jgi:hypothetical protein
MQSLGPVIYYPSSPKLLKIAVERSAVKHAEYILNIADEPAENLVFVDECAVNQLNTYRENGWAIKGQWARKRSRFVRGIRLIETFFSFCCLMFSAQVFSIARPDT